jgi:flagella basal body P-ring formation protein FlgA
MGDEWHVACFISPDMRITSKYRRCGDALIGLAGPLVLAAATVGPLLAATAAFAGEMQDVAQIEALAKGAAALQLPPLSDRQRFLVGPLPPHLQLQRCGLPIKPAVGPTAHMKDRVLVELRCPSTPGWHLYVPVRVVGISVVAVAAHAIVTGSVLKANDMRMEQHDMIELPPGYLDDPAIVVGLTAARPIASGAMLTNQQFVASKAVQRGQTVTLIADAGGVSVRMAGRVLTDGLVNQRVRVQNLSSGKVVEGIARSEQIVEIIFQ